MALGVTLSTPDADRVSYSREDLEAKIRVSLGGRVAEEVVYGTITTGAESDIQQLTQIARQMVGRWGMSEAVGPIAVLPADGQGPLLPGASETSEQTQRLLDEEVRRLVDEAHAEVTRLFERSSRSAREPCAGAAEGGDARRAGRLCGGRRARAWGAAPRGSRGADQPALELSAELTLGAGAPGSGSRG